MRLEQILLLTDKADLAFSYEILLHPYEKSKVVLLSKRERLSEIDLSGYYFIIADLSQERRVREFLELCDFYAFTRESIVLISPYESRELERFAIPLKKLSFIIKKPFLTSKLTTFIDKEMQKPHNAIHSLAEKNISYLVPEDRLLQNKESVIQNFNELEKNSSYLYSLMEEDLEQKLHFDDITSCDCVFDGLKSKLFMLKSFSSQIKEHGVWYEHLFFYTNTKYVIHTVSDITVQKDKELRLQLASSFFENTNEGIIIANENVEIESVNSAFCAITGYTQDEVLGKNPRFLKSGIHDEIFYKEMWQAIKVNGYWKGEIWNKRKNADIYPQSFKTFSQTDYEFSINIAASDFLLDYLEFFLLKNAKKYNIDPSRVVLEMLEDITTLDSGSTMQQLKSLRAHGFKFAIDDFGAENSNLSRLLEIHPDYLKIDGQFIRNIVEDKKSQIIVDGILLICKNSNIKVIAEYVHNEAVQKKIKELGVDYSQGYYFGKPEAKLVDV